VRLRGHLSPRSCRQRPRCKHRAAGRQRHWRIGRSTTLSTKRLSLLKELLPQLRRVAMLWNKGDRGMSLRYDASAVAARELGIIIQPLGVSEPDDFIKAFDTMNRERPDAILMVSDSLTLRNRRRVFEYAAERRLPAIYETDSLTRECGLMSYGPDRREIFERSAALVDRIFKGTKPPTCRSSSRRASCSRSIGKPQRRWGSTYRTHCSHLPMRWSNKGTCPT